MDKKNTKLDSGKDIVKKEDYDYSNIKWLTGC